MSLSADLAVCRVEHTSTRHEPTEMGPGEFADMTIADTTIELVPVTGTSAGEHLEVASDSKIVDVVFPPGSMGLGSGPYRATTVAWSLFPLTTTETALLVEVTSSFADPGIRSDNTVSTLYRVTPEHLTEVLSFESTAGRDENKDASSSRCKLVAPKRRSALPKTLAVACIETDEPHDRKATSKSIRYELPTS